MKKKPENVAIGRRIRELREDILHMNQEDFAKGLGVTRGSVGNWELGGGINRENLVKISRTYNAPLEWLSAGRPPRPQAPDHPFDIPPATMPAEPGESARGIPAGTIPEIDVIAGLGGGGIAAQAVSSHNGILFAADVIRDHWRLPEWILSRWHVKPSHVAVLPCRGDSMYPTISDGDPVFIDTRHRVPSPPGIYALADEFGGVVVKRLEVVSRPGEDPVRVLVSSDNKNHQSRELILDELAIIGRYLGRLTT